MADELAYEDAIKPASAPQEMSYEQAAQPQEGTPQQAPSLFGAKPDIALVDASKPLLGPILRAFRSGWSEGWGPEEMGISQENTKQLQELGFFRTMKEDRWNPFKAANELLFDAATRTGEVLYRGGSGLLRGGQAAVQEALGGGALGREVAAMPEAFLGTPHPLGVPKEFVKPTPVEAIQHDDAPAPAPVRSRAELAKTGDPIVDGVLDHPTISTVINNAVVDRSHSIPYEAGGSLPLDNPTTYVDKHVPQTFTVPRVSDPTKSVTFDTGEPTAIHENVEEFTMQKLIDGGMKPEEAYRVAHFDFAQFAEHAWYAANDIDADAAEAEWKKIQPGIQHEIAEDAPPDLYQKEYPGADVTKARHEEVFEAAPTAEESLRGREIMRNVLTEEARDKPPAPDLAEARGLGVIGPDDPPPEINSAKDVDRVVAARRSPDEKITQEVGAEDPWETRWKQFTSKIDKPEDVQRIIRDPALEDKDRFMPARQGQIPMADLANLADQAGVDAGTLDRAGVGRLLQNDVQVRIAMKVLTQTAEDVRAAAAEHAQNPSDTSGIKLQETIMRRDIALEQALGFRGEWGRTGNVFQEFLKEVKDQEALSKFMKDHGRDAADLDEIAKQINGFYSVNQAARYLSSQRDLKPTGFLHWIWTQSLISGLFTHAKYFFANTLYTTAERVVTPAIAATVGTILRSPDRVLFGEAAMGAMNMTYALPRALYTAGQAWKSGTRIALDSEVNAFEHFRQQYDDIVAAGERYDKMKKAGEPVSGPRPLVPKELVQRLRELEKPVNQIVPYGRPEVIDRLQTKGLWGRIVFKAATFPGDMAMSLHTAFKVLGEQASLSAEAYRKTVGEGQYAVHSAEFWDRYDQHMDNPSIDMSLKAIGDAYKGTFMQELGPQGKNWAKWTKEQKGVRWAFPFSHIPINIMKATYEHTPMAFADGQMRADLLGENGGPKRDMAVARVLLGSSIMGFAAYKALTGDATGEWPHEQQEQRRWKQNGIQPNSAQVGGWWVSYNKFGPMGNLAQIAANFMSVAHVIQDPDDDNKAMHAVWQMGESAFNLVKDETGFLSVAMFVDAMSNARKGEKWVANQIGSLIPFSSFLGQTAGAMDPNLREVKSFIDALKYKVPGLRETLPVKRDVFGQPIPSPAYGGNPFFGALRSVPVASDPVLKEMDRLELYPATPRNNFKGIQLPAPLFDKYLAMSGAFAREKIDGMMRQPSWDSIPEGTKIDLIKGAFKQAREAARGIIQTDRPDMITQATQNRIGAITGQKPVKKLPAELTP